MKLDRIELGGKYWTHEGQCSPIELPEHVHRGDNVILLLAGPYVPANIREALARSNEDHRLS